MSGVANFEEDAAMAPFARHARQQAAASAAGPSTSSSASSRGNKHGNRPPPSQSKSSKDSAPNSKKPKKKEQDEDELGSDLDDSDDDADAGQDGTAGIDSGDFIIALYEKARFLSTVVFFLMLTSTSIRFRVSRTSGKFSSRMAW